MTVALLGCTMSFGRRPVRQHMRTRRTAAAARSAHGPQRVFAHVLVSSLVVSVANFTVWFAVTFWTYLETRSVTRHRLHRRLFLVATASTGIWFGSLVDHHRKQVVIQASAVASFVFYAVALAVLRRARVECA